MSVYLHIENTTFIKENFRHLVLTILKQRFKTQKISTLKFEVDDKNSAYMNIGLNIVSTLTYLNSCALSSEQNNIIIV